MPRLEQRHTDLGGCCCCLFLGRCGVSPLEGVTEDWAGVFCRRRLEGRGDFPLKLAVDRQTSTISEICSLFLMEGCCCRDRYANDRAASSRPNAASNPDRSAMTFDDSSS